MASHNVILKREGPIVIVTLNRPDKMNALNKEILEEFKKLLDVLETDRVARAIILTASGEKAFCVGADLKERQGMNEKDVLVRLEMVRNLYLRWERLSIPSIAAVNGVALGGGLELALVCDLRIGAENITVGLPETELAIIPGNGGTQRLSRLIGMSRAMEMVLLAKKLTAVEAKDLGILNRVVPASQLMKEAMVWAQKMSESGPIAIQQAKKAILRGREKSWEDALQWEVECYKPCLYSKDRLEGLRAFSEKRKPVYNGD
ncbi:enoyl-CoA hydratase [bacterium]|nr:enoyl-CoA hydratase [bacterium]